MIRFLRKAFCILMGLAIIPEIAASQVGSTDSIRQVINSYSKFKEQGLASDTVLFRARNELARILTQRQPDSAIHEVDEVIRSIEQNYQSNLSENAGLKSILGFSYNQRGIILSFQGNYTGALENYQRALELRLEIKDKKSAGNTFNNLGVLNKNMGNYPEAIRNHLEAMKIREEISDSAGIAMSRNNIGSVYFVQQNYPEALKNYSIALDIRKGISDKIGVAGTLNNIGNIYILQGDFKSALQNYLQALQTAREINDKRLAAECFNNIGNSYFKQYLNEPARKHFTEALSLQEEIGDRKGMITTCKNLGLTYQHELNFDDALAYFDKAMFIARSIQARDQEMILYADYATLYSRMKRFDLAYENQLLYSDLRDTLLSAEKNQQIAELQTRYETEKKDKEIAFLNKEKALKTEQLKSERTIRKSIIFGSVMAFLLVIILVNRYRVLTEQRKRTEKAEFEREMQELQMKALRSQMNPHFIFNCLNSIQRYILKNDKNNAIEYLQKFASLIRLILDNSEKNMVTLQDEITMLDLYMHLEALRLDQGMYIDIQVDEDIPTDDILIPSMILQPFVENAILHGLMNKEEKGRIKLSISRNDNLLKCIIEDNGIGREMAASIKAKRTVKHQSKGLNITRARIELLNQMHNSSNSIIIQDMKSEQGIATGTRVEVVIPVS